MSMQSQDQAASKTRGKTFFISIVVALFFVLAASLYMIHVRADQIADTFPATASSDLQGSSIAPPVSQNKNTSHKKDETAVSSPQPNPQTTTGADRIAQTGPTETIFTTLIVGMIVASGVGYRQSRLLKHYK